ncbi:hypothetical protein Skr01_45910 [Sphaerisporangium krabiense]|uniref:DUF4307 domain-containing protein n=1 Tax=Sphaerisporangium krabiense TaxID=763782 RepID=A0A7W8Z4L0_9ACTN|nr:DUF4307 domain-containing protein [Sphaerisporangium krabiense]MBB5627359.1 hypothetical protein [Sphaerisporangium krabiense]GII64506.1 hypothetical protein Skr01_45910 [Sphaerisporangium krabiense]
MAERGVGSGADAPVLGTPDAFPDRTGRNGRAGRSVVLVIIAVVVAAAMGGWGYVMMTAKGDPDVQSEVIAFEVQGSDAVTITFQTHKAADRAAVCRLRATDTEHVEVGARDVSIPAGQADGRFTERVTTSARATSGHVQYCYLVQ